MQTHITGEKCNTSKRKAQLRNFDHENLNTRLVIIILGREIKKQTQIRLFYLHPLETCFEELADT